MSQGDTQSNVKRFFRVSGCSFRSFFGIEGLSGFDHFADDSEESVGDASECAGVLVAPASQRMAIRPAGRSRGRRSSLNSKGVPTLVEGWSA